MSEKDFKRGREKEVLHNYGKSSSPYDDDYSPIFTNNMNKNYLYQNSENSEKSKTEFTNYFPPQKILKLRNREIERKINTNILNFKSKNEEFVTAEENYDNEKKIKCVIQESFNSEMNVPQKLVMNASQMLMKNILKNEEKNLFNNEEAESEDYLNKEKEKISNNINKIKNKIFPELQEHLIKRFSYEKINSSSQTDNNHNFNDNNTSKKVLDNDILILNERKTDFRSFGSVFENNENEKINETFREINNRFVAMKIIRFDNDKLGLIFAKVRTNNIHYFIISLLTN